MVVYLNNCKSRLVMIILLYCKCYCVAIPHLVVAVYLNTCIKLKTLNIVHSLHFKDVTIEEIKLLHHFPLVCCDRNGY